MLYIIDLWLPGAVGCDVSLIHKTVYHIYGDEDRLTLADAFR